MNEKSEGSMKNERLVTGFDHDRLEVTGMLLEALKLGNEIASVLARGQGTFADQLRRALQGAYLQAAEAASRRGQDRIVRLRAARSEAGEAAAAGQAIVYLRIGPHEKTVALVRLLDRVGAMLWRLAEAHGAARG